MNSLKTPEELLEIFFEANKYFLSQNVDIITAQVSERTLCGTLMIAMNDVIRRQECNNNFEGYFLDVEYNRNNGKVKTIINGHYKIVTINCDLILHSRGHNKWQDNLIALEMKKSNRPLREKKSDRERLIALTKDSDGVWSADGITLPKNVCGYALGIYYEINLRKNKVLLEFYKCGERFLDGEINILGT